MTTAIRWNEKNYHKAAGDHMPSLHFTETMRGFISEKELRDHDLGARLGRRDKRKFEFTVTIQAKDLDRFLQDPKHKATLSGTVNYEPLGGVLRITRGSFNLFTEEGGVKKMKYEIYFSDSNRAPYVLTGQKLVVNDPGADLWTDTTTLFSELRKGRTANAPVVAVGVIRVHLLDFLRQLTTIRILGGTPKENAQGAARFGRFFFGDLWDTYVRRAAASQ